MIRRSFRIGLWAGVIAALAYMASRTRRRHHPDVREATDAWPAIQPAAHNNVVPPAAPPTPKPKAKPATKAKAKAKAPVRTWVEPSGDTCPPTHPMKAKEASKIFHVPGGLSYDRTQPDRCYTDESAAEADGYRKAKR
jgi:hypothetical protein